jgi:transcriptional repressor NrdR
MYCPFCLNTDTKVLESRVSNNSFRRRRECLQCNNRFTTYEKAVFNLNVLKKDGREQPFDLSKIKKSIDKSVGKVDENTIHKLSQNVERGVLQKKMNPVKSIEVAKLVMRELKKFDKMAYLRFASVYKEMEDVKDLKKELGSMT